VGPASLDPKACENIESWKKFFPDYEILEWNNSNIPLEIEYVNNAYKNKRWANVSNYVRLYALNKYGGIYFDTDVEVLKRFDFLNEDTKCFLGIESHDHKKIFLNNAILGAERGFFFLKQCIDQLIVDFNGLENGNLSSPILTTKEMSKLGKLKSIGGKIKGIDIFPKEYFYPLSWDKDSSSVDLSSSYAIHYGELSWFENLEIPFLNIENIKDEKKRHLITRYHLYNVYVGNISLKQFLVIFKNFLRYKIGLALY